MFRLLTKKLIRLNRISKQAIMVFVDSILVILIILASFSIRLSYFYWPSYEMAWVVFGAPLIAIPVFIGFKMYRSVVRYIGLDAMQSIFQAVTFYSVIWGLWGLFDDIFSFQAIPRSVILINWMLCLIVIGGSRVYARWVFSDITNINKSKKNNVIVYGAGLSGRELSNSLQLSNEYSHIAYIDDDEKLCGSLINGKRVYKPSEISFLVKKYNVRNLFLALPSISRLHRNKIISNLASLPLLIRSLPRISELAEGKIKVEDLREINIKDLLGRESIKPNINLLKGKITNKVVLVTGAGGSIGSELCRQIISFKPKHLIFFEVSESSLYKIQQEILSLECYDNNVSSVIGSIRDLKRMTNVFERYKVQTIYHAAAYKHVPLVEYNQSQGVLNNSIGTMCVAKAAIASNVETFVLISTDKAVRPTNTMGASKRVAELVLQGLANQNHSTCLTMVRFGNVLDSSGSVIPLFKKQIKEGGPITITDKDMVRYFMTIPEAVELVIQAGAMGKGGDVFVLDMGEPVRINDLAKKMIRLSGLQVISEKNPDGDIEIVFTGLRPGEKLYEELLVGSNTSKTENKLIMRAKEDMLTWDILEPLLNKLEDAAINGDSKKVRELLIVLVPEFSPNFPVKI